MPAYQALGSCWEESLGAADVTRPTPVHFADVDCAAEEELCRGQDVAGYPVAVHYRRGLEVHRWSGGRPGLLRWVRGQLAEASRRQGRSPSHCGSLVAPLPPALMMEDEAMQATHVGLVLAMLVGSAWIFGGGLDCQDAEPSCDEGAAGASASAWSDAAARARARGGPRGGADSAAAAAEPPPCRLVLHM